jgi:hypothetical protein
MKILVCSLLPRFAVPNENRYKEIAEFMRKSVCQQILLHLFCKPNEQFFDTTNLNVRKGKIFYHIEVSVVGDKAFCTGSDKAVNKLIVIRVGGNQFPTVKWRNKLDVRQEKKRVKRVSCALQTNTRGDDFFVLQQNFCAERYTHRSIADSREKPMIRRLFGERDQQHIGIHNDKWCFGEHCGGGETVLLMFVI